MKQQASKILILLITCSPALHKPGIPGIPKDRFHNHDTFNSMFEHSYHISFFEPWINCSSSRMAITPIHGWMSRWFVCWLVGRLWWACCAVWTVIWAWPSADPVQRVRLRVPVVVAGQLLSLRPCCLWVNDGMRHNHITLPALRQWGVRSAVCLKG